MSEQERDIHFRRFAKLQMPELDSLFIMLYQAYARGDTAKRDEYSKRIETYLAQHAYDLAIHVTTHVAATEMDAEMVLRFVPDLAEWPEKPEETH